MRLNVLLLDVPVDGGTYGFGQPTEFVRVTTEDY